MRWKTKQRTASWTRSEPKSSGEIRSSSDESVSTDAGHLSLKPFVDTCIVSDGLITLCIMPNCLADNISLYCGDPYERFACILVYEDLFTRRLRQLRRAPFAARLG